MDPAELLVALFYALKILILARVVLSWVDRNPFSDNPLKKVLYGVTDPLLEPLRRFIPPLGGTIDITPIVAIVMLDLLQTAFLKMIAP